MEKSLIFKSVVFTEDHIMSKTVEEAMSQNSRSVREN